MTIGGVGWGAAVDGRARGVGSLIRHHTMTILNNNRATVTGRRDHKGCATHRHVTLLISRKSFRRCSVFGLRHYRGFNVRGGRFVNSNIIMNDTAVSKHLICISSRSFAIGNKSLSRAVSRGVYGIVSVTVAGNTPFVYVGSSNKTHVRRNVYSLTNCNRLFRHGVLTDNIVPRVSTVLNPYTNNTICSPTLASFVFVRRGASGVFLANPIIIGDIANRSISTRGLNNTDIRTAGDNIARFASGARRRVFKVVGALLDCLPSGGARSTPHIIYSSPVSHIDSRLGRLLPSSPGGTCSVCGIVHTVASRKRFFRIRPGFTGGVVVNFTHFGNRDMNVITGRPSTCTNILSAGTDHGNTHFIHFYSTFGVPVIDLISIPNFLPNAKRRCGTIVLRKTRLLCTCNRTAIPGVAIAVHGSCKKDRVIVNYGRLQTSLGFT